MAYTQIELDKLKAAYARGELSVQFGDRRVQYDSGEELLRRIKTIEKELNQASFDDTLSPRYRTASFSD